MQERMRTHQLGKDQIDALLARAQTGCLSCLNEDNTPYATPIHFLYDDGAVFFHCRQKGKRMENLKRNPNLCLSVYEMDGLLMDSEGAPCNTNTKYQSVLLNGRASAVEEFAEKEKILRKIVHKYTPHLAENPMEEKMVKATAV
ncbi:pyridoxamine 5'-phosphate oxidase family protein, partial [Ruminococcaceae bacterium OttesenSCG-928-I18]|nr:pyridoxamine 5'-phosphate oxidase family protein [Ruminococcaceae bacterium OttesenSCG-928-I18]